MPLPPHVQIGRIGQPYGANTPFSVLSAAPSLWLDAADTSSITHNSGAVSRWNDKSGRGSHAIQNTPSLQPNFASDSSGGYIQFNGGNLPVKGTTSHLELLTPQFGNTLFFVADWNGNDYSWVCGEVGTNSHIFLHNASYGISINGAADDNGEWRVNGISQGSGGDIGSPAPAETTLLHTVKFDTDNPSAAYSRIASYHDDAGGFGGKIREVIFLDRQADRFETERIEGHLLNKWGIV